MGEIGLEVNLTLWNISQNTQKVPQWWAVHITFDGYSDMAIQFRTFSDGGLLNPVTVGGSQVAQLGKLNLTHLTFPKKILNLNRTYHTQHVHISLNKQNIFHWGFLITIDYLQKQAPTKVHTAIEGYLTEVDSGFFTSSAMMNACWKRLQITIRCDTPS